MQSELKIPLVLALLFSAALGCRANGTMIWDFEYTLPASDPVYPLVEASGTLTTGDFDSTLGGYQITDIQGTRTVSGIASTITGIIAPGAYFGFNTNVLYYPGPPFLDWSSGNDFFNVPGGLAYMTDDLAGQLGTYFGAVFVYFDPAKDLYTENAQVNWGSLNVSPAEDLVATPEPRDASLVLGALFVGIYLVRVLRLRQAFRGLRL